jgi:hypothetical protein
MPADDSKRFSIFLHHLSAFAQSETDLHEENLDNKTKIHLHFATEFFPVSIAFPPNNKLTEQKMESTGEKEKIL